jgi:interferon gamma-inducible protein 30
MSFADVLRWLVVLLVPFASASSLDITARVKVYFYMESLCPFCGIFATGTLKNMMNEIGEIVELSMIPSGNMRPDAEGTLQCQHGPEECAGNRVEACAMHLHPDQDVWFPFVLCFEENFPGNREFAARTAEKCAKYV